MKEIEVKHDEAQWLYDMGMHETLILRNATWYETCCMAEPSESYFRKIHGRIKINGDIYKSLS